MLWRVGTGTKVRIGIDPWIGCKWRHTLPDPMIVKLHNASFYALKDIACIGTVILQDQVWLTVDFFDFVDQEIIIWNNYVSLLTSSHVRINTKDD